MRARLVSRHSARLLQLPLCVALCAAPLLAAPLPAQSDHPPARAGRGQFGGQPPVSGTVTALSGNNATIKTEAGEIYQVVLTPNTRVMRERQPARISDIHIGDMLTAIGEVDRTAKTVHAAFAMDISAEQVAKMREGLGKVWIAGRVLAINDTTLTIRRIDNVTQKIQVDETTSFRKRSGRGGGGAGSGSGAGAAGSIGSMALGAGADAQAAPPEDPAASGDSVTLADIKAGDNVAGRGSIKNGFFVPTILAIRTPAAGGRGRARSSAPETSSPAPDAKSPAPQPGGPGHPSTSGSDSGSSSDASKGPTQ